MKLHHVAMLSSSQENADKFYEGILKLRKIKTSLLKSDLAVRIFGIDVECPLILYGNKNFAIEVFVTDRIPHKRSRSPTSAWKWRTGRNSWQRAGQSV